MVRMSQRVSSGWSKRRDDWLQDAMFNDRRSGLDPMPIPPPIYHGRMLERSAAERLRGLRERRLRQAARGMFFSLLVIVGMLLVAKVLMSVEPPGPDTGDVINQLDRTIPGRANELVPSDSPAFVEGPFTQPMESPAILAKAALLVDMGERTIVFSKSLSERRAPASLTKLATAVVALELAQPHTKIQVPSEALDQPANVVGLQPGEVLTLQDLLFALLLSSGNDAAVTIADGVGGQAYTVAQMNDLADRLELTNTRFVNPSGLDAIDQYTTAFDMAVLAADAIDRYPLIAQIVSTRTHVIAHGSDHRSYSLTNLNGLLWTYEGAIGVKTGRTAEAGGNLIAAAEQGGRRLMVVVLGSDDRLADAETLLDFGFRALTARG